MVHLRADALRWRLDGRRPLQFYGRRRWRISELTVGGHDGNLYGAPRAAAPGCGVVFQLSPSGVVGQRQVSTVHSRKRRARPGNLVQDSSGNLYGLAGFGKWQR